MPDFNNVSFTDEGKGYPVILLHGFCETHEVWNDFSQQLSKEFRIISIDLPGFGKSKLLAEGFSIADVATKILDTLTSLDINSTIVIGHSLGGYVALAMAGQNPAMLNGFGLFHSTAYADNEERKVSRNKVIDFVSKNGVSAFVETFIPPLFYDKLNKHIPFAVNMALQTKPEVLIGYTKAMRDRPDLTHVIQEFTKPVLFIGGEKDSGITPDSVQKQANLASKPALHIIPEVAHMGMFEKESETLNLTRNFLVKASA